MSECVSQTLLLESVSAPPALPPLSRATPARDYRTPLPSKLFGVLVIIVARALTRVGCCMQPASHSLSTVFQRSRLHSFLRAAPHRVIDTVYRNGVFFTSFPSDPVMFKSRSAKSVTPTPSGVRQPDR